MEREKQKQREERREERRAAQHEREECSMCSRKATGNLFGEPVCSDHYESQMPNFHFE